MDLELLVKGPVTLNSPTPDPLLVKVKLSSKNTKLPTHQKLPVGETPYVMPLEELLKVTIGVHVPFLPKEESVIVEALFPIPVPIKVIGPPLKAPAPVIAFVFDESIEQLKVDTVVPLPTEIAEDVPELKRQYRKAEAPVPLVVTAIVFKEVVPKFVYPAVIEPVDDVDTIPGKSQ